MTLAAARIVGRGVVSCAGVGIEPFWQALCAAKPGQRHGAFGDPRMPDAKWARIADPRTPMGDVSTHWLQLAITQAFAEAAPCLENLGASPKVALLGGSSLGGMSIFEHRHRSRSSALMHHGPGLPVDEHAPHWQARYNGPILAAAHACGLSGAAICINTACSSGTNALGLARLWLAKRRIDVAVVAAADAVSPFVYAGFQSLGAIDPRPTQPFGAQRRGLNLGESAVAMVVVRAHAAGDTPGTDVVGFGSSCDAHHLTRPDLSGGGLCRAIRHALQDAQVSPEQINAISAHGTGTAFNDTMESAAFSMIFGPSAPPMHCAKPIFGHTLGAAGAIDALSMSTALQHRCLPPTAMDFPLDPALAHHPSPTCTPLPENAHILSTSSGFGGSNAAVVLTLAGTPGKAANTLAAPVGSPCRSLPC